MKILTLIIPFFFAFSSKFLPNYNINIHYDKVLHKRAFDICYSCKYKHPLLVVYKVNGYLIDKYNLSRKYKDIRFITGVCGSLGHIRNNVNIPNMVV